MTNQDVFAILQPGEPLMTRALDALKRYHEAKEAGLSAPEIEVLKLEAEALFQAVSEYQFRVFGCPSPTLQ